MWTKQRYLATNPGRLALSDTKLAVLHPELYFRKAPIRNSLLRAWSTATRFIPFHWPFPGQIVKDIRQHLWDGDCNPALVVSTSPLCVAAYTIDIDAVVLLRFPDSLVRDYELAVGSRLVSINCYLFWPRARDLVPGPNSSGTFGNVISLIGDFLSDDNARLRRLKEQIDEDRWMHTAELAIRRWRERPDYCRSGRPRYSAMPPARVNDDYIMAAIVVVVLIAVIGGYFLFF